MKPPDSTASAATSGRASAVAARAAGTRRAGGALRSRRARRGQRGAALVEAAVTIPFFIAIFVCLAFVGSLYSEKQKSVALSRQQAWTYAMQNCDGQMPDVTSQTGGSADGIDFGGSSQFESAPGGDTASKGFKMAVSTIKGQVVTKSKDKTFEQKVQTTTWVLCNEKPINGDLKGILKFAWGMFTGW
jgi:hypothetical protein